MTVVSSTASEQQYQDDNQNQQRHLDILSPSPKQTGAKNLTAHRAARRVAFDFIGEGMVALPGFEPGFEP